MHTPTTESERALEFTTFMRAYQNMVFSTAARLTGNDAQAEDIAQEAFTKAFENFEHLRKSPTAGGWLKTVTMNLALNHLTRYRRRWRLFSEMVRPGEDEDSMSGVAEVAVPDTLLGALDAEQRREVIDAALRRLPAHQRLPLVLFHFEDQSYEEIATQLRASLSKVKTDIRRARLAMLDLLQSAGVCEP